MGRYRFPAFNTATTPRYAVVWDLHWQVCSSVSVSSLPRTCLALWRRLLIGLASDGWQAEATLEYGFVFIRNGGDRQLLMLTPRDPHNATMQPFSPFSG
jgi:hypothetical protein